MDYYNRLILAGSFGLAAGMGLGYWTGEYLFWIVICMAITIGTDVFLRTKKNVKIPPPMKNLPSNKVNPGKKFPDKDAPDPHF